MTPLRGAGVAGGLGSSLLLFGGLVALWAAVAASGLASPAFLPTPAATWAALAEGFTQGDLAAFTLATVQRMALGFGGAVLAGVGLGALVGLVPAVRRAVQPTLEFLRPLPASAVMPLAIAIFGLSSGMALVVITFGAMWPVLLATVQGLASVHERQREVASALGLSRAAFAWKIGLPHALPDILAGLRLSLTVALIVAVVGEMIASLPGLGQAILLAARAFRGAELYAGIVLLGAVGFAANALLAAAERRLLAWQRP
jgi:ABC-type nitrate/sulfonate/bicarbonate transport system permease component